MSSMHDWLKDADPAAREPALSPQDMDAMLRRVRADIEADCVERAPRSRMRAAGIALATCTLGSLLFFGVREWRAHDQRRQALAPVRPEPVRQLYFSTPEGTRVLWIFNPSLPE